MEERARELLRRSEVAFRRLDQMRALYRDAYRLGCPHRQGFDQAAPGQELQREVYDSTFQDAVERFANALFVGMAPPWLQWFDLVPGTTVPEELSDEVRERLQRPAKIVAQRLLRASFYTELHSCLLDLAFGTAALQVDEDDRQDFRFTSIPVHELGVEPGRYGKIEATFRKQKVLARRFRAEFPKATIPDALAQVLARSPDEEVPVVSAIVPEQRGRREFAQYVLWSGGPGAGTILEEREFFEQPMVVPRWSVMSGEVYGRGPALKATANAYTLNEAARLILIAANVSIFGMWTVADDELNPALVKLGPGALIPVASNDNGNPSLRELVPSTRLDFAQFAKDDLRSQIQKNLYRDALGNVEGPKMTATEIIERQSLVLQDLGAAHGRTNGELLGPVVSRVTAILSRRGRLPPIRVDGELVDLAYVSPLARAQSMEEITGLRALIGETTALAQLDPSARARLDSGKIVRRLATLYGAPLDVVLEDEQVQEIMNQVAMASATMGGQGAEAGGAPGAMAAGMVQ